jgi:hypothetical protein
VDAGVAATGLDVAFEGCLLRVIEDFAGRGEEHDDVELREVCVRELRGLLACSDREAVGRAQRLDRRDALRDRVVPEAAGLREHEHVLERGRRSGRAGFGGKGGAGAQGTGDKGSDEREQRGPHRTHKNGSPPLETRRLSP